MLQLQEQNHRMETHVLCKLDEASVDTMQCLLGQMREVRNGLEDAILAGDQEGIKAALARRDTLLTTGGIKDEEAYQAGRLKRIKVSQP